MKLTVVNRYISSITKTIKKHSTLSGIAVFLFVSMGIFFLVRGATPYASELAYIEHSVLGQSAGSVVPASCDSANPYAPTYLGINAYNGQTVQATSGSHFNGDCMIPCPGDPSHFHDAYFDRAGATCPATTKTCPDGSVIPIASTCPSAPSVILTVNGQSGTNLNVYIPYRGNITSSYTSQNATYCSVFDYNILTGTNLWSSGNLPTNYDFGSTGPYQKSFTRYVVCYDGAGTTVENHQYIIVAQEVINGVCNSVTDGKSFPSQPNQDLCSSGRSSNMMAIPSCDGSFHGYPGGDCAPSTGSLWNCPESVFEPGNNGGDCGNYNMTDDPGCYNTIDYFCTADPAVAKWRWLCNGSGGGTSTWCSAGLVVPPAVNLFFR